MLEVDERRLDGTLTLQVRGEVDSATAAGLREALRRVPAGQVVVVDLRRVPLMDSAGLGALVGGIRELRLKGGTAVLCTSRGGVSRLLSLTGLDRFVPMRHSLKEAQEAISAPPPSESVPE